MAKLGDAFSDDQRRESVARRLQPGAIIYVDVAFPQGRRPKYLVVAHVEHECCTFIVNSRVHPFIEAHPTLAVCQVKGDAARHPHLRHDSHIACHEVLRLPTAKVIAELAADLSRIKGKLHPEVVTEVVAAVKRAPTLSPAEQTRLADALAHHAAGGN
ncbi:MAG: hypothetical protein A3G24_00295 [Betaproteobacteria bacterium RIFCSPLOWO2_12_FULL_62_13]|nr:MAG: hypothetical protein A3G24_00295 [Betaproteobacteria bacterium RIFCSPLOWO2_12_FULL_62_13]